MKRNGPVLWLVIVLVGGSLAGCIGVPVDSGPGSGRPVPEAGRTVSAPATTPATPHPAPAHDDSDSNWTFNESGSLNRSAWGVGWVHIAVPLGTTTRRDDVRYSLNWSWNHTPDRRQIVIYSAPDLDGFLDWPDSCNIRAERGRYTDWLASTRVWAGAGPVSEGASAPGPGAVFREARKATGNNGSWIRYDLDELRYNYTDLHDDICNLDEPIWHFVFAVRTEGAPTPRFTVRASWNNTTPRLATGPESDTFAVTMEEFDQRAQAGAAPVGAGAHLDHRTALSDGSRPTMFRFDPRATADDPTDSDAARAWIEQPDGRRYRYDGGVDPAGLGITSSTATYRFHIDSRANEYARFIPPLVGTAFDRFDWPDR